MNWQCRRCVNRKYHWHVAAIGCEDVVGAGSARASVDLTTTIGLGGPRMRRRPIAVRSAVVVAVLLTILLSFPACSVTTRTVDVARLGPAKQVQIYEGGRPVLDRPVAAGSAEERAVASWLRSHADGWRPTLVTYAPGRRVRGENFDLNFGKDQCVLNYRSNDKGDWLQVARGIRDDEPIPDVFAPERPRSE